MEKTETIRLTARNSRLSILQLEKTKHKIESFYPGIKVEIILKTSRGDLLQNVPLHTVEGSDFFTQDIFDALSNDEADIAVHSLKDMSSEHFFGKNIFAIVDRNDVRDLAIFNGDIEQKIKEGKKIVIGTCSPRREEMATIFLQKALPQLNNSFKVETKNIGGNVDTRLKKLDDGEYDGIILATAGLNRLLESEKDSEAIKRYLANKKLMLLPLIECVPAPCQGAILAETISNNTKAVEILSKINDDGSMLECLQEKRMAMQYGIGCLQRFGVTTISVGNNKVIYASGKDSQGKSFSTWSPLPEINTDSKKIFSAADFMGRLFDYEYDQTPQIKEPIVYVSNYKATNKEEIITQLLSKKIWCAGTKTWFELAKQGIWVEGCADAFGLEFLLQPWSMPLFNIIKDDVAIITNHQAKERWQAKGWNAYYTYYQIEKFLPEIEDQVKQADIIFWTSYQQYLQYKNVLKENVQHICPYGETAEHLKKEGIDPIVFPNIKAFQQWKQTLIPLPSAA